MKPSYLLSLSSLAATTITANPLAARDASPITQLPSSPSSSSSSSTALIVPRDGCHDNEVLVYRTRSSFLCIGKTVYYTGVAVVGAYLVSQKQATIQAAAEQFASWVKDQISGELSKTLSNRGVEEGGHGDDDGGFVLLGLPGPRDLEIFGEDDESVTYGRRWTAAAATAAVEGRGAGDDGDGGSSAALIHNMTARYDKSTGLLSRAEMTFDGSSSSDEEGEYASAEQQEKKKKRDGGPAQVTITYFPLKDHLSTSLSEDEVADLYRNAFVHGGDTGKNACGACGYAANSGTWHGAFKLVTSVCGDPGDCANEKKY
ncbi:hypothetical protein F4778DRAFT_778660 [Xylariomycetidae sp. FL2044]|nr:hypothetical protein F4778DRAFT_778660 [Xylariomycetidae sp. FL2044]